MAEETDLILASDKINGDEGDNAKDQSAEKVLAANKRADVVPHYLRASTGSCHDACKYGKPHVFKEKPWKTATRRLSAPLPDAEKTVEIRIFLDKKVKKSVESVSVERPSKEPPTAIDKVVRRSSPLLRRSPVHDSFKEPPAAVDKVRRSSSLPRRSPVHDSSKEPPAAIDKVRRSSPFLRRSPVHDSSKEPPAAIDNARSSPFLRRSPVHDSSKLLKTEFKPFRKSPSPEVPKVMKRAIGSPGRLSLPDASKLPKQEGPSAARKDVSSRNTPLTPKGRSSSAGPIRQNRVALRAPMSPDIIIGSSGKQNSSSAGPIRQNRVALRAPLSPDIFIGSSGKQNSETKFTDLPRPSARKGLTPAATVVSVKRSPKLEVNKPLASPMTTVSSLRTSGIGAARSSNVRSINCSNKKVQDQKFQATTKANKAEPKEPVQETLEEKSLHMVETKEDRLPSNPSASHLIRSPSPLSPESLNSSSQANSLSFTSHEVDEQYELDSDYTDSDADDDSVSNYNSSGDANAADSLQRNSKNTSSSEDQDPKALKLKFRRGKVVELQSDTNSPRKLRFRQGKSLGDGTETSSRRKNLRKTEASSSEKEAEAGLEQVALKHQEVMAKDEQVSLNNVIEETASKLVEKKKSKVKALVGAFETVISLQERKPSAAANR